MAIQPSMPVRSALPPADVRRAEAKQAPPVYDPSPREKDLVSMVNDKFEYYARERFEFERQWYSNIAYFLGFHYHTWQGRNTRLASPIVPTWRVRLVANRIFAIAQSRVAKLTRNRPVNVVIPASTDDEDLLKARLCEKALKAQYQQQKLRLLDLELAYWITLCGNAFYRVFVDPTAGDLQEVPRTRVLQSVGPDGGLRNYEQPEVDEKNQPIIDRFNLGDVGNAIVPPFEIYPEPGGANMRDVHAFIHVTSVHIDKARLMFPAIAPYIRPSQEWTLAQFFQRRIKGLVSLGRYSAYSTGAEGVQDHVVVKHYQEQASPEYPKGRCVTVVNDMLAQELASNPYGGPNYVLFGDTKVPGRFWYEATFSQLVPLNKSYNRGRSQIKESKNLMSKPKWLNPNGSGVLEENFNDSPGEVIGYNPQPNMKPEVVNPPPIPDYVFKDLEYDLKDLEFIGGISGPSLGINPPNVESGIHLAELAELDETKFGPLITDYETHMSEVGELRLKCMKMVYDEPRLMMILGENSQHEIFEFSKADMPEKYDVRVQVGSALPTSKIARQDFVMNLWGKGLIRDEAGQPDYKKAMQLLEFGDYEKFMEEQRQDEKNACMENLAVKRGDIQNVRVEVYDDHGVHLKAHNQFRKSDFYRTLDPNHPLRLFMDQHVAIHQGIAAQLAANAAMLMQAAAIGPGGAPGEGNPPGPGGGSEKTGLQERREEARGGQAGGRMTGVGPRGGEE